MGGPAWLADLLAALMLLASGYCTARLALAWLTPRLDFRHHRGSSGTEAVHIAMGVAMAGMFVPALAFWDRQGWAAVFGVAIVWFVWSSRRSASHGPGTAHRTQLHVLEAGAMVYMLLAPGGSTAWSLMAMALLFGLIGCAVLCADGIPLRVGSFALAGGGGTTGQVVLGAGGRVPGALNDPRLVACCDLSMFLAMAYMLVLGL